MRGYEIIHERTKNRMYCSPAKPTCYFFTGLIECKPGGNPVNESVEDNHIAKKAKPEKGLVCIPQQKGTNGLKCLIV